jgi:hypothetical protein
MAQRRGVRSSVGAVRSGLHGHSRRTGESDPGAEWRCRHATDDAAATGPISGAPPQHCPPCPAAGTAGRKRIGHESGTARPWRARAATVPSVGEAPERPQRCAFLPAMGHCTGALELQDGRPSGNRDLRVALGGSLATSVTLPPAPRRSRECGPQVAKAPPSLMPDVATSYISFW